MHEKRPLFYDPKRCRGGKESNPPFQEVGERLAEWVRSLRIEEVAPNDGVLVSDVHFFQTHIHTAIGPYFFFLS